MLKNFLQKQMISSFQSKVYEVVKKIPRGQVLTYHQVARRAGYPKAARAVGSALNNNYNPAIPCHRVIRSDGALGKYNRGAYTKEALLRKEGYIRPTN